MRSAAGLPVIAIVGRPNVGKSTLFNRLIGRRRALVRDVPGVTRDRLYGRVTFERWQATAIDTGGFDPASQEPLIEGVRRHVLVAVEEADLVLFVVDARDGATALDLDIAEQLRRAGKPVVLAANKVESADQESGLAELYRLGFGTPVPVSAEHGRGVAGLLEVLRQRLPAAATTGTSGGAPVPVAVIGRPNVGKSSLVNAMVGADRVLVHEAPGTTRDAVDTTLVRAGRTYVLVDTAGIRRKGRVHEPLEKLAVVMALRSLERCQVALVVLDASEGVAAQDAHIAGYANEAGRAIIIVVNKWDLVPRGMVRRAEVMEQIRDRLPFLEWAPVCFTSATRGEGIPGLFFLFCGVLFPISVLPEWGQNIGRAIPITYWLDLERRILLPADTWNHVTTNILGDNLYILALLLVSTLAFYFLSVVLFRLGEYLARRAGKIDMTTAY